MWVTIFPGGCTLISMPEVSTSLSSVKESSAAPPPFCVLDEIEAALDDVNVARFAQYLRRMSRNSQFITITHRRGTMEGSDMLYGVTMQDQGISKLLALRTEEAAEFGT